MKLSETNKNHTISRLIHRIMKQFFRTFYFEVDRSELQQVKLELFLQIHGIINNLENIYLISKSF